jgi:RNA polymerase sigma-70 factor (ECF subfamily)
MQNIAVAVAGQAAAPASEHIGPWLYRVAVRQCLLFRRQCGRRRRLLHRYAQRQFDAPSESGDPLDWLLADERRRVVRQALLQLPRRDVEILLLKYCENDSYAQIAQRLGISSAAVEARLHRARQRLRSVLRQQHGSEGMK